MSIGARSASSRSTTALGEGGGFFFPTPELNQNLDLLHHLVENSDRIPLLKGPDGVGKSVLLERLEQQAGVNWRICRIDANPMLQSDQLFSALAGCFEVAVEEPRLSERLTRQFENLQQEGWLPVVVIDDAQLLPVDTLVALLQLYESRLQERIPFRLVLFASPGIEDLLQAPQTARVNTRSLQELLLLPQNLEQTRRMLQQFLQLQGFSAGQGLSDGQLERIFRDSEGFPGEALSLAEARLRGKQGDSAATEEKVELKLPSGLSWTLLLGGGGLLLVVALILAFQDRINVLFEGETSDRELPLLLPEQEQERVVPLQREQTTLGQVGLDIQVEGQAVIVRPENLEPILTRPELPGERPAPAARGDSAPVDGPPGAAIIVDRGLQPSPAGKPVAAESMLVPEQRHQAGAPVVVDEKPAYQKSPQVAVRPLPIPPAGSPAPEKALPPSALSAIPEQVVPPPAITAEAAALPSPRRVPAEKSGGVQRESWLLRQKPNTYTLQLIGLRDEQAVKPFLKRYSLQQDAAYFRTLRDGRPWFSVVYGIYTDRAAALDARRRLPGRLGRGDAWPRTFGSIQQLINNK